MRCHPIQDRLIQPAEQGLCLWLRLRARAVGLSPALLFVRQRLKALGCLKELIAGLVDRERLNYGPDLLRLPAILHRLVVTGMMHGQRPPTKLMMIL
jgi:hypothetical protein